MPRSFFCPRQAVISLTLFHEGRQWCTRFFKNRNIAKGL
jgi:hypothetical protein